MAWIFVACVEDVRAATMLEVEANGVALLLYDLHGCIRASSAICPHHAAWLSDGRINGDCIECPRHMGSFHIETGEQRRGPASPPLAVYQVRVEEEQILVWLP